MWDQKQTTVTYQNLSQNDPVIKSRGSTEPRVSDCEQPAPTLDLTLADENAGLVTGSGSVVKFKWFFFWVPKFPRLMPPQKKHITQFKK